MQNVVPLYYHMKKAVGGFLNWESIYNGLVTAFKTGNIGPKSNLITIVHNNSETNREEANTVVKWLTAETNYTIDASKTLYNIQRPPYADVIIKKHTQYDLPHFFIWAKNKNQWQVESSNKSTMNRIADKIPSPRIIFNKDVGSFDYRMLMNWDINFNISQENEIVNKYNYWNTHQYLFNFENNDGVNQEDIYMYQKVRQNLLEESNCDIDVIVNVLISYLYTVRPNSTKKMLWACFGDVIVENLKRNTLTLGYVCPICGKRFQKQVPYQIYCSQECYTKAHRQQAKNRKSFQRENE